MCSRARVSIHAVFLAVTIFYIYMSQGTVPSLRLRLRLRSCPFSVFVGQCGTGYGGKIETKQRNYTREKQQQQRKRQGGTRPPSASSRSYWRSLFLLLHDPD